MNSDNEYQLVEAPLVQTLETLGWATLDTGAWRHSSSSPGFGAAGGR